MNKLVFLSVLAVDIVIVKAFWARSRARRNNA